MKVCIRIKPETKVRLRPKMKIMQFLTKHDAVIDPEGNPVTLWATLPPYFDLTDLCELEYVDTVITSGDKDDNK